MKITWLLLLLSAAAGVCLATPAPAPPSALVRTRRQLDFFDNTRNLIEELIDNLSKAAGQAKDAVTKFNSGMLEQAKRYQEKFIQDLKKLQERVSEAIDSLQEKFINSGSAVGECITSHRGAAAAIYQDASRHMAECADARIQDGSQLVSGLSVLGTSGQQLAEGALHALANCSDQHRGNILGLGACLGGVALRTELKGASFLMQSGLAIGRVNLFMSTLPAALEVCAGSGVAGAGAGAARLLMEIGTCSAHSFVSNFGGVAAVTAAAEGGAAAVTAAAEGGAAAVTAAAEGGAAAVTAAAEGAGSAVAATGAGANSVGAGAAGARDITSAISNIAATSTAAAADQINHLAFV